MLIAAHFVGGMMSLPFVLIYGDFYASVTNPAIYSYLLPSVFFHSSYLVLLSNAYFYGDVGLVYPLARGTAITLATITVELLAIGNRLTVLENVGVGVVICGILTLAYDAFRNIFSQIEYSKISSDSETEMDGDVEMATSLSPMFHEEEGGDLGTGIDGDDNDIRMQKGDNGDDVLSPPRHKEASGDKSPVAKARKARSVSIDLVPSRPQAVVVPPVEVLDDAKDDVNNLTRRVSYSILFAFLVGCCTASYSVNDSFAVHTVPAITYSFLFNISVGLVYVPYLIMYKQDEFYDAVVNKWRYLLFMAPATTGAYLIILFVFELPGVNLALVVALREFSVLVGTILGIFVLKERASGLKVTAVCVICVGMALLKLG